MYHQIQVITCKFLPFEKILGSFSNPTPLGVEMVQLRGSSSLQGEPHRQRSIEWIQAARAAQRQSLGVQGEGVTGEP